MFAREARDLATCHSAAVSARPSRSTLHGQGTSSTADATFVPAWPASRVKSELVAFLATQPGHLWPADDQFVCTGHGPLLRELEGTGGAAHWRREIGSKAKLPALRYYYWTDSNIAATLSALLKTHGQVPSRESLLRLGYPGLPTAIARRGATYWLSVIQVQGESAPAGAELPPQSRRNSDRPVSASADKPAI